MKRSASSHKGENGKVAVVGGSRFIHGAPIFSALAAEASGVDLIFVRTSSMHEHATKEASYNFQVIPFAGGELTEEDRESTLGLLATMDCAVLGPGIARNPESIETLMAIIAEASCPLVLDATALQHDTLGIVAGKTAVLTPHMGELERMSISMDQLDPAAKQAGVTIVLKGETDRIAGPSGPLEAITGGNAGLTVGGTGDALAGLIAGLIAQGTQPAEAARMACRIIKRAGTVLYQHNGIAYTTADVIGQIPRLLHTLNA